MTTAPHDVGLRNQLRHSWRRRPASTRSAISMGVYMLVFMMMAVGLNIVVGYAGLLDLGYVAFYATGAYTTAWFASAQFAGQKCPTKGVSVDNCSAALVPNRNFLFGAVGVLP